MEPLWYANIMLLLHWYYVTVCLLFTDDMYGILHTKGMYRPQTNHGDKDKCGDQYFRIVNKPYEKSKINNALIHIYIYIYIYANANQ